MNVFEYLDLPADYRKASNKVTQLVKHFAEVPDSRKKDKNYCVQLKKDGVCALTVVRDGAVKIFSRTGKEFTNVESITTEISSMILPDGVYFGELCCDLPHVSLEMLSGVVNPNRVATIKPDHEAYEALGNLIMYFYDVINLPSFRRGNTDRPFYHRHDVLDLTINGGMTPPKSVEVVPVLSIKLEELDHYLQAAISGDEEGIVIIDKDAGWEAGHKGWRKMKLVRGVDYDLRCIGYEEGTGKYKGKVANLIFQWKDGKTIKCMLGKGWTHDMAEDMFKAIKDIERNGSMSSKHSKFLNPLNRIFQVYALEESSKGKLRLPKVGEQRHDKGVADV